MKTTIANFDDLLKIATKKYKVSSKKDSVQHSADTLNINLYLLKNRSHIPAYIKEIYGEKSAINKHDVVATCKMVIAEAEFHGLTLEEPTLTEFPRNMRKGARGSLFVWGLQHINSIFRKSRNLGGNLSPLFSA